MSACLLCRKRKRVEAQEKAKARQPDPGMAAGAGKHGRIGASTKTLLTQHLMKQRVSSCTVLLASRVQCCIQQWAFDIVHASSREMWRRGHKASHFPSGMKTPDDNMLA